MSGEVAKESKTTLERLCQQLILEVEENMEFKPTSSVVKRNKTMFIISAMKGELSKLEKKQKQE